jgi:L-asparaginase II
VESVHEVEAVVVAPDGERLLDTGGTDQPVFARSAIKPFQALPLVLDGAADRYGLTREELALACASHSGEARHVAVARSILARAGLAEDALACGPHEPFAPAAAASLRREGREPGRIHNNCSGKHAGMLLLAQAAGWSVDGYHEPGHPVQQRVLKEVARWTGLDPDRIPNGVDGCGVVTFALPLAAMAGAFARLAAATATGEPAGRPLQAMAEHPFMVGGSDRLCSAIIEATDGHIVAKVGAEGVYTAALLDRGCGLALKVRDGARRAAEVALLGVLDALEALEPDERTALAEWSEPPVRNTRGETVGGIRARVEVSVGG